ncbi:hypothetical protein D9611_006941 [Ephemerocybe angulata]|uniref:tRNA (cytosine(38)-C(5))-methyltransferase n=1 Tax=Ephemerocybe angulata TaxID=980116 RepID=A0A8H5B081_9AGAR|nr:hypothetical protein D9611_006941 [Tulosesus angulatus]
MSSASFRTLEFYCGIGGLHYALKRSRPSAEVVAAFDWDPTSCQVYGANHGEVVQRKDISTLTPEYLEGFDANLWLMSPACQPYTVLNPEAKGAADPRAMSFLHIVQSVLPEMARRGSQPGYILVENVAGFETSSTRELLVETLKDVGYETMELLLSPLQYGIPNSRLRYYMLARKQPFPKVESEEQEHRVWRHIPGQPIVKGEGEGNADVEVRPLKEYLDAQVDAGRYVPDKILGKWGRLFDIVKPSSARSCCFTRGYTHIVERSGSILQEAEDLDTTQVFDAFLRAQSEGREDALEILRPLRLRYFTPSELLRIFAFEEATFVWPESVSMKTKYRLIGNSVNVRVVQALVTYLLAEQEHTMT